MTDGAGHETRTLRAADGCSLFYQVWRPSGEARGIVVLVHGLGEHSDRYPHLVEALVEAGYALVTYDLRGHGRSGGRKGHVEDFSQFRADLDIVLDSARGLAAGRPVFLYGHSLGSLIALDYIQSGGDGLRGGVLSALALDVTRVAPAWQVALLKLLSRLWPSFSLTIPLPGSKLSRAPEVCAEYDADPMVHATRSARLASEGIEGVRRVVSQATAVHVPALFLHGEQDPIAPLSAARAFFQAIPGPDKTMHVYPGGLHEPHNDIDHERVMRDVVAWLQERSQPSDN